VAQPGEPVASRAAMLAAYDDAKHAGAPPRPATWGGYRVRPLALEFWRGGELRLHDRFRYKRDDLGAPWRVKLTCHRR